RCSIESCFREGKEELGLDHYEVRGWRCVHRHFYVTQLSHLFCARVRLEYDTSPQEQLDRITVEQVKSAMNVWLDAADLPPAARRQRYEEERQKQQYYQRRNKQARVSHTKTRLARLQRPRIDITHTKSCLPDQPGTGPRPSQRHGGEQTEATKWRCPTSARPKNRRSGVFQG
ncbi:MAG: hypothetical protein GY949_20310, partial [Gammaproteobacteria bacterium]|nr:hypothetical protein [Gammaproteobacteria bacterium]